MENDILICNCNEIYKSAIVKAIKEKVLKTVEEVGEETTAGTVCGKIGAYPPTRISFNRSVLWLKQA